MAPFKARILMAAVVIFAAVAGAHAAALNYDVSIKGGTADLNSQFKAVSRLYGGQATPPPGYAGLEQRAQTDQSTFLDLLHSNGYYNGSVGFAIDESQSPVAVTLRVDPGKPFLLSQCEITYTAPAPAAAPRDCGPIGLKLGMAAKAEPIIAATERLKLLLQGMGRPAANVTDRIATVDHAADIMHLNFKTDPGPAAVFGAPVVSGTERTHPQFLERIVPWKQGASYDVRAVQKYRKTLSDLNLFDSIVVEPDVKHIALDGAVPMDIEVHESLHHSIELGAKYATDTGPGALASWEDRNIWGNAEDLKLTIEAGTLGQLLSASLTLPDRPNLDQTLLFSGTTERDTTDAYDLNGEKLLGQISAPLGGHWTGKGGLGFEGASVNQGGSTDTELLAYLPLNAGYDSTGSLLDPSHGDKLDITVTPVAGAARGARTFLVLQTQASAYRPLNDKLIAAARIKLGTILFAPEFGVPADWRFYAGGGGSVRGYAYQHVAPRDDRGVLIGGRSLAETSFELRYRAWTNIGIVGFADAGMVSTSPYFASGDTPRVGAGVGVRYYTSFGPLRLDVATPLNPYPGDAPVQIYISLGQAF